MTQDKNQIVDKALRIMELWDEIAEHQYEIYSQYYHIDDRLRFDYVYDEQFDGIEERDLIETTDGQTYEYWPMDLPLDDVKNRIVTWYQKNNRRTENRRSL